MKTIISQAGTFGPFGKVEVLADRLKADSIEFQFDLLGEYQLVDGAPPQLPVAPPPEMYNAPILAQLEQIDAKSIRALREGDPVRIAALEAQAAALRVQLIKP